MSNEIIEEILTKNPPLKHTYVAQNHEIEKARCIKYARTIAHKEFCRESHILYMSLII